MAALPEYDLSIDELSMALSYIGMTSTGAAPAAAPKAKSKKEKKAEKKEAKKVRSFCGCRGWVGVLCLCCSTFGAHWRRF